MKLALWVAALCAAALPVVARADSFQLFGVNAMLAGGGSVTGTVNLNLAAATTSPFTSTADLRVVTGGATYTLLGNNDGYGFTVAARPSDVEFDFGRSSSGLFALSLPLDLSGLSSYTGGALCSTTLPCYTNSSFALGRTSVAVTSGTLTRIAATPEPGSMALLGTGLLAMAGVVRRRVA